MKQPPSLVRRLIVWQLGAMGIAWLALSAWLMAQMMAFGDGDLDRRMEYFARALAEAASAARDDAGELKRRLQTTESIFVDGFIAERDATVGYIPVYQLQRSDGRPLYASPAAPREVLSNLPRGFSETVIDGHNYRTVAAMSSDGSVRATVGERTDQRWSANWPILSIIGFSQLLIFSWIVAVTWIAGRRGFQPLTDLAAKIAQRQPGDLSPLRPSRGYAETSPIVDEINGLLAREERRLETERGFLADAAHELRTPLAAINAQAHVLVTTDDDATRHVALEELRQGMDRVSHLLFQLLTMARLEAGPVLGAPEKIDVAELCRQRLAALSRLARARAVDLQLDAPEAIPARINRGAFLSIVDNLVDNAIRYTPSGGHVAVKLSVSDQSVVLEVRDDGPGISPENRERVFERFVRLPGSTEQGSGLGLAIVRRVVASQAATLSFIDGLSGGGVGFQVWLPQRTRI